VLGPDGRRLAKRHRDTRFCHYRAVGMRPERASELLGWWCGVTEKRREMTAAEFRDVFAVDRLSQRPIMCTEDNERWLCGS
jgi:glutamyl-tRNA synthetase